MSEPVIASPKKGGLPKWLVIIFVVIGAPIFLCVGLGVIVGIANKDKKNSASSAKPVVQELAAADERPTKKPVEQPAPKKAAPMAVSAKQLIAAYQDNEVAADNAYKGKLLQVEGRVDRIAKNAFDEPYIAIGGMFQAVHCSPRGQDAELAALKKGQLVRVEGTGNGMLIGEVMLDDCQLVAKQ